MALERRLATRARESGVRLDRLRRRVLVERIVSRLESAEPGCWVLKGGMALEARLGDAARLTRDIDLGLRDAMDDAADLRDRMIEALRADPDDDRFVITARAPVPLREDGGGHLTWRMKVALMLAGKPFGNIQLDVSPRAHELTTTDRVTLTNSLDFAGVPAPEVEIVDVNRHAAEKFHGMVRDMGDRENSRVRDLLDLVLLVEHDLLTTATVAEATRQVWNEREGVAPPAALPPLPRSWPERYERLAAEHRLTTDRFPAAVGRVSELWDQMFPAGGDPSSSAG